MTRVIPAFLLVFVGIGTGQAWGQAEAAERQAAARALFDQGLDALAAERFDDAADRFERAYALRPSPEIAYNLSAALIRLGQLVRASEVLRQVTQDAQAPDKVRAAAESRLQQVLPRLGRMTLRTEPAAADLQVRFDGRPLEPAMVGVAIPVDPGSHKVEARRDGVEVFERTVTVAEGASILVNIEAAAPAAMAAPPPKEPEAVLAAPPPDPPPPQASGGSVLRKWWFWALVVGVAGGTAAAIAVGTRNEPRAEPGSVGTIRIGGK